MAYLRPFQRTCVTEDCHELATKELWDRQRRSHGWHCDDHAASALETLKGAERRRDVARGLA